MKQLKQVIMLTTEKAEYGKYIVINKEKKLVIWDTNKIGSQTSLKPQHLYIISDEKIVDGDWYVHNQKSKGLRILQCNNVLPMDAKKIIATTDKSLNLPLIPESFVKAYVEAQGNIKEVLVEYMPLMSAKFVEIDMSNNSIKDLTSDSVIESRIKTRSDSTIIISPSKTYTREEVRDLIHKAHQDAFQDLTLEEKKIWENENL